MFRGQKNYWNHPSENIKMFFTLQLLQFLRQRSTYFRQGTPSSMWLLCYYIFSQPLWGIRVLCRKTEVCYLHCTMITTFPNLLNFSWILQGSGSPQPPVRGPVPVCVDFFAGSQNNLYFPSTNWKRLAFMLNAVKPWSITCDMQLNKLVFFRGGCCTGGEPLTAQRAFPCTHP